MGVSNASSVNSVFTTPNQAPHKMTPALSQPRCGTVDRTNHAISSIRINSTTKHTVKMVFGVWCVFHFVVTMVDVMARANPQPKNTSPTLTTSR